MHVFIIRRLNLSTHKSIRAFICVFVCVRVRVCVCVYLYLFICFYLYVCMLHATEKIVANIRVLRKGIEKKTEHKLREDQFVFRKGKEIGLQLGC